MEDTRSEDVTAALTHALAQSSDHYTYAENLLAVNGQDDQSIDEMSRTERAILASSYAQLAQVASLVGIIRSNHLIIDELQRLNHMVTSLVAPRNCE